DRRARQGDPPCRQVEDLQHRSGRGALGRQPDGVGAGDHDLGGGAPRMPGRAQRRRLRAGQPEAAVGRVDPAQCALVLTRKTSMTKRSFKIYPYDPENGAAPSMQSYEVELDGSERMLLDALMKLKAMDPSLSFRR